jgi:hypothetical protein
MTTNTTLQTFPNYSPTPWSYDYSPYTAGNAGSNAIDAIGEQIAAYEVFDATGNKVFDTNEDTAGPLQEANARLAAAAPELLEAVRRCILLLADHDQSDGEEGDIYLICIAAEDRAICGHVRSLAGRRLK